MDADTRISILIILILLFLAAFFAISETAISSVQPVKIKVALDRGDERAKKAIFVLDNFEKAVTTLLICTNIVHLTIASMVTVIVTKYFSLSFVSLSTIITTIVVFFLGEMLPKSIGKNNSEKYVLSTSGAVKFLMNILSPISYILSKIGSLASRLMKQEAEVSVTEDELLDIIEDMANDGVIEPGQEDIMSSVLDFTDTRTSKILTKKEDIIGIDINLDDKKAFEYIKTQTHSRLLVYDNDLDHVLGILRIREYFKDYLETGIIPHIKDQLDDPYYVSSSTTLDELLEEMSNARQNIALVKNKNNNFIGIVSIEDILEELVGEIFDEFDIEEGGKA